jgi:hypothetical protein
MAELRPSFLEKISEVKDFSSWHKIPEFKGCLSGVTLASSRPGTSCEI